jgi:hypothetical protein
MGALSWKGGIAREHTSRRDLLTKRRRGEASPTFSWNGTIRGEPAAPFPTYSSGRDLVNEMTRAVSTNVFNLIGSGTASNRSL